MSDQALSPWRLDDLQNVGHVITETAGRMPDALAVAAARKKRQSDGGIAYDEVTFGELEQRTNRMARGFLQSGINTGDRIALLVPPGIDFVACVFALFKCGATVVLIDPGMGKKNMVRCLAESAPVGMVGVPLAHVARMFNRGKFRACVKNFVVGSLAGFPKVSAFDTLGGEFFSPVAIKREDPAAIIFTTGSTGPPKGVLYRHRIFIEQAQQIRDYFNIQPGTVDVSGFPLFALFNAGMGATTVFPDMDPTRPANVHPPNIIDAVDRYQADQSFGSPALWNTVSRWCIANEVTLPTIKRILSAGAPVPASVLKRITSVIASDGDAYTPYGATEALPVACNSASVILGETAELTDCGMGTCVGPAFETMELKVIQISDQPLKSINDCQEVARYEVGELMVRGVTVTDYYVTSTDANDFHKVRDGNSCWHRMGDVGYIDSNGRFWFCGRKSHRVKTKVGTMFTVPCESIVNTHPNVYRSALVGVGSGEEKTPVMVVEPEKDHWPGGKYEQEALADDLRELASRYWQTDTIMHFLFHRSLPVDIRHNSKIFREKLRPWAAKRVKV